MPRSREVEREPSATDFNQLTPTHNPRADTADPRHFNSRKAEEHASHPGQSIPLTLANTKRRTKQPLCPDPRRGKGTVPSHYQAGPVTHANTGESQG